MADYKEVDTKIDKLPESEARRKAQTDIPWKFAIILFRFNIKHVKISSS